MLFVFAFFVSSLKPVVLIPGVFGSLLNGTVRNHPIWYCPNVQENVVWIEDEMMIPPFLNCMLDEVRLEWDEENQKPKEPSYLHLWPGKIGDLNGVTSVDYFLYETQIVPTYGIIAEQFVRYGYVRNESLFGLGYDWRFSRLQTDEWWNDVVKFIEEIVERNGEKAVLVGHSMGGHMIHHFLTEITTSEWREKYIDCALLLAPSLGGSGMAFSAVYSGRLPKPLDFLGSYKDTVGTLGGLLIHMPNKEIFGDTVVYRGLDGQIGTANNLTELLKMNDRLPEDGYKIYEQFQRFFDKAPEPLDVPVSILYNSGVDTPVGLEMTGETSYDYISGPGDWQVNVEGLEWICSHWPGVECTDLEEGFIAGNHFTMLYNDNTLNFLISHVFDDKWKKK